MAKCPNCGKKLKWYEFRAECKSCGTNIPNYNWEARLEEDADKAETSFAKLHYRLSNFKSATVGSPFRIIRLVATLLPLVGLVVPLMKVSLSLPFYEDTSTVSFLSLILNYITKLDFMGGFQLMSATALGSTFKFLMLAIVFAFVAVLAGVLNFLVVLIAAASLKAGFNIFLNVVATAGWIASAVLLSISVTNAMSNSIDVFSGNVIWWGYAIGAALFLANVVISVAASKSFKKQLSSQPTMDEYIANELEEIRTQA